MSARDPYAVDDSTGSVIALEKDRFRPEVLIKIGGNDVWVGFNEPAVAGKGIPLRDGEWYSFDSLHKRMADYYFVCASGEQATVYIDA